MFHPRKFNPFSPAQLPKTPIERQGVKVADYKTRPNGTVAWIRIEPLPPPPEWQECYRTTHGGLSIYQDDEVLSSVGVDC